MVVKRPLPKFSFSLVCGIGFELFMASSYYFTTTEVGFITIMIFICAMILEFCSTKVKAKFAVQK